MSPTARPEERSPLPRSRIPAEPSGTDAASTRGASAASGTDPWSRDPSALLRTVISVVGALAKASTPSDVYEGACRALHRHGISAVILASRADGRFTPITHRLGATDLPRVLDVPDLLPALDAVALHPAGRHPLARALPQEAATRLPSITVALPSDNERLPALVSVFAPGLTSVHQPAAEAFAALLGAAVSRAEGERRLRELTVRLEQRVRARTEELTSLFDLSSALGTAATDREAARLAVGAAARSLTCDVAAALLCVDQRHTLVVAGRGVMAPRLLSALMSRLTTLLETRSSGGHAACTDGALETADHPLARAGIALDGDPAYVLEAPVVSGGRVVGLTVLANQRETLHTPEQTRLLATIANQLGAAAERLTGARFAERERLSALMEGLAEGVVLLDAGGQVLACNQAGRDQLAALGGEPPGTVPAAIMRLADSVLTGEGSLTADLATSDERPRRLSVTAARIADVTGATAVALSLHDTTDEALMRERLFQTEKMASVGQLVSGVAHELNNPLAGILGFAQLLMTQPLDPETRRYVATITGEAERASKIVQNLLSFARRRTPEKTEVDVNLLITRVLELREYEQRVNDITVHQDLAPALPPCLADPHQIQQVLLNVIVNAEQALRAAGRPGAITVRTEAVDGYVRIAIGDDGPGIPAEHLRRVFDPFFTTKPVGEGTGLGLTISYGIIEEHNGRIDIESRPGGGVICTIGLPVAPARVATPPLCESEADGAGVTRAILVVDDEPAIRELLAGLLSLDGHHVETARTGSEALERIAAHSYDAIITDIRMPEMNGIEFYERVARCDPELARRIIFTSGDTVSRDTRAFVEAEAVRFLPKPFKLNEVRELVRAVVEDSHRPALP